jgi:hypothetical protein
MHLKLLKRKSHIGSTDRFLTKKTKCSGMTAITSERQLKTTTCTTTKLLYPPPPSKNQSLTKKGGPYWFRSTKLSIASITRFPTGRRSQLVNRQNAARARTRLRSVSRHAIRRLLLAPAPIKPRCPFAATADSSLFVSFSSDQSKVNPHMKYKEESQFYSHQARKRHAVLVEIKTELEKDIDAAQLAFEQKKVHEICEF